MYQQYGTLFNFITIYIAEAHASNEWPIRTKKEICINQHKTSSERCNVANKFKNHYEYHMKVFVDPINNIFESTYSAWPLRVFVIYNGIIQWVLHPKQSRFFDFNDLISILKSYNN